MFKRAPIHWVPKLDADTTGPIYGINWGDFKTYILRGWWLKQVTVKNYPGQHNMDAYFLDCMYQWVAKNRRSLFVGATGTTYPS